MSEHEHGRSCVPVSVVREALASARSTRPEAVPIAALADLHARHAADAGTTFARLLNDLGSLIGDAQYEPDDDRGDDQR